MDHTNRPIILVIGSEGFLGRYIVGALLRSPRYQGTEIRAFDTESRVPWPSRVIFYKGSLCEAADLTRALQGGVTTVFQTASPRHDASTETLFNVNVLGMKQLIKLCRAMSVRKLIYSSSAMAYFTGDPIRNLNETCQPPNRFINSYSHTKHLGESLVLKANGPSLKTCSLRLFALIGPGETQIAPPFIEAYQQGLGFAAIGDNLNLFDFTSVENAADAHLLACASLDAPQSAAAGEAFFISNGTPVPFFNVARKVIAQTGLATDAYNHTLPFWPIYLLASLVSLLCDALRPIVNLNWQFSPFNVINIASEIYFDISKAKKVLGYNPHVTLDQSVQATANFFMKDAKLKR